MPSTSILRSKLLPVSDAHAVYLAQRTHALPTAARLRHPPAPYTPHSYDTRMAPAHPILRKSLPTPLPAPQGPAPARMRAALLAAELGRTPRAGPYLLPYSHYNHLVRGAGAEMRRAVHRIPPTYAPEPEPMSAAEAHARMRGARLADALGCPHPRPQPRTRTRGARPRPLPISARGTPFVCGTPMRRTLHLIPASASASDDAASPSPSPTRQTRSKQRAAARRFGKTTLVLVLLTVLINMLLSFSV
ncbi:hypothetical protein B0H15DRAFT_989006 [Mycena belliarum]|uniref:Uncharacterized protein n=1 Tax=Mycena belliarum TaxID=1033014 RepID=A0AAD6U508_9AGAR|nr:hypothetical protein B0H15DRAFT_989006 [Mycena belliae]